MLLDCGLMFPDIDMLGVDLVLPDFTYLRENADRIEGCIITHGHEDHVGGLSLPAARAVVPDLRLGAHPRPGPQPHRGGRAARPHRADPGRPTASGARSGRSTSSSSRSPTRCPTASPPRSTRPRARSCTRATSSSTSRRSTAASPTWPASAPSAKDEGIRLLLSDSTNADEPGHSGSETSVGKVLYDLFHQHRGPAHRHRLLRQPHPPRPADRATPPSPSGARSRRSGLSMKKNVRLARDDGPAAHPRPRPGRHRRRRATSTPARCASSPPAARASRMSALALMATRNNRWLEIGADDTVILSSHPIPGNEMNVSQGDRRAGPARRRGRALRHRRRARHAATPSRRSSRRCSSIAEPEWFVPVHGEYRHMVAHARLAKAMGVPTPSTCCVCDDGDQLVLDDDRPAPHRRACPPATSTSTASSATSARACCATARCWPRRAWSSSSLTVDVVRRRHPHRARGHHPGLGATPPRPSPARRVRRRGAPGGRRRPTPRARSSIESLQRVVRRAAGGSCPSRTKRRPMIVPVVMEA